MVNPPPPPPDSPWAVPTRPAKVCDVADLAARLGGAHRDRTVVLSQGSFDLVHLGHIRHFRQACTLGDLLVVAVTGDAHVTTGPGRPRFTLAQRMEFLAELECVDFVVPNPTATAIAILQVLRPDIYIRGQEYRIARAEDPRFRAEREVVASYGGRVMFTNDALVRSSTALQRTLP